MHAAPTMTISNRLHNWWSVTDDPLWGLWLNQSRLEAPKSDLHLDTECIQRQWRLSIHGWRKRKKTNDKTLWVKLGHRTPTQPCGLKLFFGKHSKGLIHALWCVWLNHEEGEYVRQYWEFMHKRTMGSSFSIWSWAYFLSSWDLNRITCEKKTSTWWQVCVQSEKNILEYTTLRLIGHNGRRPHQVPSRGLHLSSVSDPETMNS